ncbi:MAG: hypothetical protein RR135_01310 [Oscillospiraceae bacterium]
MEPLIYDGVANGFAMRNGAFGATAEADLFAFTDVVPDSWAALHPKDLITRAVALAEPIFINPSISPAALAQHPTPRQS